MLRMRTQIVHKTYGRLWFIRENKQICQQLARRTATQNPIVWYKGSRGGYTSWCLWDSPSCLASIIQQQRWRLAPIIIRRHSEPGNSGRRCDMCEEQWNIVAPRGWIPQELVKAAFILMTHYLTMTILFQNEFDSLLFGLQRATYRPNNMSAELVGDKRWRKLSSRWQGATFPAGEEFTTPPASDWSLYALDL